MTSEERAHIVVTSRLLRAAGSIQWLAIGLTVVAAVALIQGPGVFAPIAATLLGLVAIFYGIRVSFDAKLFEDVAAERLTTSQLDLALNTMRKAKGDRSWIDRCRGAKRLAIVCATATILQMIAVMLIRWP